jgi:hypothetical protein
MMYKTKDMFVRDFGARHTFYCDFFMREEKNGKTKMEIMAKTLKNELVKSPRALDYTFKFYEKHKDLIGWI